MTPFSDAPPIRCFLSYARQDDVVMDFVGPFADALRQYAYADRGRSLEIFLDRASIGWGDLEQVKKTGRYPSQPHYVTDVSTSGYSGRHVVVTVWKASHMDQKYFLCSDVDFG